MKNVKNGDNHCAAAPTATGIRSTAPARVQARPWLAMAGRHLERMVGALLAMSILLCAGCIIRAPILLNEKSRKTNPMRLPIKVGIVTEFSSEMASTRLCRVRTIPWEIPPVPILKAGFPRVNEPSYLLFSIRDYLLDNDLFTCIYPSPFDPNDVDVILAYKVSRFEASNFPMYSGPIYLLYYVPLTPLNFLWPLVLPQERFSATCFITAEARLPDGKVLASYASSPGTSSEWVWIYQQPFAEYMWYKSVFRGRFLKSMDEIGQGIEKDRDRLIRAAEEHKRHAR